ncbi:hypothetical protein STEG23_037838, partial [Scotinomys teguina]
MLQRWLLGPPKQLHARPATMAERPPRRAPPARALLLALAGVLLAPHTARGVNLWDQRGTYEVARASILSKDPGIPGQSFPAK